MIYGIVLAVIWIFDLIWYIVTYHTGKEWEGTVTRKKHTVDRDVDRSSDGDSTVTYHDVYYIYFRTTDGRKKKSVTRDNTRLYDYLAEGDAVKYHRGGYYEKYDKSRDMFIPCAACGSMRDARETFCGRCGCIMMKAKTPYIGFDMGQGYGYGDQQSFYQNVPKAEGNAPLPQNNDSANRFCPDCGSKITDGAAFCRECGRKL